MWRRNLTISWITQVLSIAGFQLALPFIPYYIQELGITDPTQIRIWSGLLSSGPALSMAIMAPVWGLMADKWGKKTMLIRATLGGAVIMFALGTVTSISGVLVLRIIQGMLTGTVGASAALVATGTPKDRMSYALGMLSSSTFIGFSLGPLIGGVLAEWVGYRATFRIGSVLLLLAFTLILFLITEVRPESVEEPEVPLRRRGSTTRPKGRLATILSGSVAGLLVVLLILRFGRALPAPFIPIYIQEVRGQLEGSAGVTGLISAARGLVTAVAALTVTRLGDRLERLPLAAVLLGIGGVLTIPIYFTGSLVWFAVFLVVGTFFLGGVEPMLQAEMSNRTPASRRGLLFGVQTTVGSLGWFLAPALGTWISIAWGIPATFLVLAASLLLAAGTLIVVRRLRRR